MSVAIKRQQALLESTTFFHVREASLPSGSVIAPGRWGQTVLSKGKKHPFFFREHLLELYRKEKTTVLVSRFDCTFVFGSCQDAQDYASPGEFILEVIPQNFLAPYARLDMLWLVLLRPELDKRPRSVSMNRRKAESHGRAAA